MSTETFKAYITKYALTSGIISVESEISNTLPFMLCYKAGGYTNYSYGEGVEWHRTIESAITRSESMRLSKIKSLEKSIEKMKSMKFIIKD